RAGLDPPPTTRDASWRVKTRPTAMSFAEAVAQALLAFRDFGCHRIAEILHLIEGADLELARPGHRIRAAFGPGHRLVHVLDLPDPVTGDQFTRLREGAVAHGPLGAVEGDPLASGRGLEPVSIDHHASLDQLLVELSHRLEHLRHLGGGRQAALAVLGRLHEYHHAHVVLLLHRPEWPSCPTTKPDQRNRHRRGQARAEWRPSANSSTIFRQNAGRSSGLRLDTMPWSVTTSSSTTSAPALRRSVRTLGQEVMRRPRTTSASIIVHGPWQITPMGLPLRAKSRTNATAASSVRSRSGLATPPGRINASNSSMVASATRPSTLR